MFLIIFQKYLKYFDIIIEVKITFIIKFTWLTAPKIKLKQISNNEEKSNG